LQIHPNITYEVAIKPIQSPKRRSRALRAEIGSTVTCTASSNKGISLYARQNYKLSKKSHMKLQPSPFKAQRDDQELARVKWAVQELVLQVPAVA
jgi:hypothetical protein